MDFEVEIRDPGVKETLFKVYYCNILKWFYLLCSQMATPGCIGLHFECMEITFMQQIGLPNMKSHEFFSQTTKVRAASACRGDSTTWKNIPWNLTVEHNNKFWPMCMSKWGTSFACCHSNEIDWTKTFVVCNHHIQYVKSDVSYARFLITRKETVPYDFLAITSTMDVSSIAWHEWSTMPAGPLTMQLSVFFSLLSLWGRCWMLVVRRKRLPRSAYIHTHMHVYVANHQSCYTSSRAVMNWVLSTVGSAWKCYWVQSYTLIS